MFVENLETLVSSFSLVAVSELGDKTQLLAFSLASRFKRPLPILAGILIATILNHWLAALVGATIASYISEQAMAWILAGVFIACGFWALIPDKLEENKESSSMGAFFTTLVVFFMAEMGDKTQLATVALAARHMDTLFVTIGTTAGMMLTNSVAVFAGHKFADKVQSKWVRLSAAGLFFLFGLISALEAMNL